MLTHEFIIAIELEFEIRKEIYDIKLGDALNSTGRGVMDLVLIVHPNNNHSSKGLLKDHLIDVFELGLYPSFPEFEGSHLVGVLRHELDGLFHVVLCLFDACHSLSLLVLLHVQVLSINCIESGL